MGNGIEWPLASVNVGILLVSVDDDKVKILKQRNFFG